MLQPKGNITMDSSIVAVRRSPEEQFTLEAMFKEIFEHRFRFN
jgi:hypothetical protein